jgi:anthranilate phosphoribosyltransferase
MMTSMLSRVIDGQRLSEDEMAAVVTAMLDGQTISTQVSAFLAVLRARGETVDELVGAVRAVQSRAAMVKVDRARFIDTCGTGGDHSGTFNISTAAAIVASACGVVVAKHGNRSVSSRCGSADVLAALGARIDLSPQEVESCIEDVGLGFLFAPSHHPAFRHIAPVRKELGVRTLFNLLGPLANPAGARHQVVGVFDERLVPLVAEVLARLGSEHALVVHGSGLDEVSLAGPTRLCEVKNGVVETRTITPEELGLSPAPNAALEGGDAERNAVIIREVLSGRPGPNRDVVLANAAAALVVGGRASSLREGISIAADAIDTGAALEQLHRFVARTQGTRPTRLGQIVARTRADLLGTPTPKLERPAARPSLRAALSKRGGPMRVIAEVKRRSPSKGQLATISDPVQLARTYSEAGAAGISVLTNEPFFGGMLDDLVRVSAAVPTPTLRKEFVVDHRQLVEAVNAGSSAVLLIAAVLGPKLAGFIRDARALGLDALVEVHDEPELDLALASEAEIVGINNRNLHTFEVDLATSERLLPRIPDSVIAVCESGVKSIDDAVRLRDAGAANLLIGEWLVTSGDPADLLRSLACV